MNAAAKSPGPVPSAVRRRKIASDVDLRRDRKLAALAILLFLALMALAVWLANLGYEPGRLHYDYWLVP